MKWQEEGVILSIRLHGESSAVVSLLTQDRGRHAGIVRVSSRNRTILQPGNFVQASWSARLPEHLGAFQLELISSPIARIMADSLRLTAMMSMLTTLDKLLAERHPYPPIYDMAVDLIHNLTAIGQGWLKDYAFFELRLLDILGYGLDLSRCAATGQTNDLVYVSPRSGCAISQSSGVPYADKLFVLPSFILDKEATDTLKSQIAASLKMTGYFLGKYFFNGILPDHRSRFSTDLERVCD